jgi:hypothetical protein
MKSKLIRETMRNYLNALKWRDLFHYGEIKAQKKLTSEKVEELIDNVRKQRRNVKIK